jgi:hypothetical protein
MRERPTISAIEPDNAALDSASDGGVREFRLNWRKMLFVLATGAFAIACVVWALRFFVDERIPTLTDETLDRAAKLWKEIGPGDYDLDVELRGAQPGNVHVVVRNRVVTETTRDGRVPPKWTWDTWSVTGMFDTLAEDLQIAENPEQAIHAAPGTTWRLRCEFDPKLGFPRRYHRLVSGGPEVYWRVTRFEVR